MSKQTDSLVELIEATVKNNSAEENMKLQKRLRAMAQMCLSMDELIGCYLPPVVRQPIEQEGKP